MLLFMEKLVILCTCYICLVLWSFYGLVKSHILFSIPIGTFVFLLTEKQIPEQPKEIKMNQSLYVKII